MVSPDTAPTGAPERHVCASARADETVACGPRMRALLAAVAALRERRDPVLVLAEPGSGRRWLARRVHEAGASADAPFVEADASSLLGDAPGRAAGGTLYVPALEALAEPALGMLGLLMRPGGRASADAPPPPRLVVSTRCDLRRLVADRHLDPGTAARLGSLRLELPPLRERLEDLPALVHLFLRRAARRGARVGEVDPELWPRLLRRPWPGNLRELEELVTAAALRATGPRLREGDLAWPPAGQAGAGPRDDEARSSPAAAPVAAGWEALPLSLEAYERTALSRALAAADGDARAAARLLGIGRSTLYRKLARHGLRPTRGRGATATPASEPPSRVGPGKSIG